MSYLKRIVGRAVADHSTFKVAACRVEIDDCERRLKTEKSPAVIEANRLHLEVLRHRLAKKLRHSK